jgi:hypothetical protein
MTEHNRQAFVLDRELKDIGLEPNSGWYVGGGACTSVFSNSKIHDLDLFFCSPESLAKALQVFTDNKDAVVKYSTDNAVSYRVKGKKVQLIKKQGFVGPPVLVVPHFDFTVSMCAYMPDTRQFYYDDKFMEHLAARTLVYNPDSKNPLSTMVRVKKFLARGYSVSGVELVKLGLAVNNLSIVTYKDLKEQLEGIDTVLLKELTDALLVKADSEYDFREFLTMAEEYLDKFYGEDEL